MAKTPSQRCCLNVRVWRRKAGQQSKPQDANCDVWRSETEIEVECLSIGASDSSWPEATDDMESLGYRPVVCVDDDEALKVFDEDHHMAPAGRVVEVWHAGEWKELHSKERHDILCRHADGSLAFRTTCSGREFEVNLEQMTRTDVEHKRTRIIRFSSSAGHRGGIDGGFEDYRRAYYERAEPGKLNEETLSASWRAPLNGINDLLDATVQHIMTDMQLRPTKGLDLVEWCHFWALEQSSPCFRAARDLNTRLQQVMIEDPHTLGRLQMHYETALSESSESRTKGITLEGLCRACRRILASVENAVEKQAALDILQKQHSTEELSGTSLHSYYDFLNLMLGRKKFKVSLWLYDLCDGKLKKYPWALKAMVGKDVDAIWHTGIIVDWPEKHVEYWYGGGLFESHPGKTPFGQPQQKRDLGYTYKLRDEVMEHLSEHLALEYKQDNYDVLTHNCNNFSDDLAMHLLNEHIPDDILKQPEMVTGTVAGRLCRPMLNRWLGGCTSQGDLCSDRALLAKQLWMTMKKGVKIVFTTEEGTRPLVGEVAAVDFTREECTVTYIDFWRGKVEKCQVPRALLVTAIVVV